MQALELPLKPIHLSEIVSWWPPAIGWWILASLLLLLLFLGFWLYKRNGQRKRVVKSAQNILAELKLNTTLDCIQKLSQLSVLLRRVAISLSADRKVAGLTGRAWLAYLDQNMQGTPFSDGIGRLLIESPYRKSPPTEAEFIQLLDLCEIWLKTCRKKTKTDKRHDPF